MRSVSRSLMSRIHTSAGFKPATTNYGFRASHLLIVLGLALLGSQLLARPMSAQQGGSPLAALAERVAALETANANLTSELAAVKAKTAPISVDGDDFKITGKNVFIQDGSGQTVSQTGLGNLTVGYNVLRDESSINLRTGTHNLIVGDENNFTSYGGFVAGYRNNITNAYCSVSGGASNTASGTLSSVSGGGLNNASGHVSSVSGGNFNKALGTNSSVSGGHENKASGQFSSVSGGDFNRASEDYSSVSGGYDNAASGSYSSVSGGTGWEAPEQYDWRAGQMP